MTALCRDCHGAYDTGQLDLLPYREPAWRAQLAQVRTESRRECVELPESEAAAAATRVSRTVTSRKSSTWTPDERTREEGARRIRARQDRAKTPEGSA